MGWPEDERKDQLSEDMGPSGEGARAQPVRQKHRCPRPRRKPELLGLLYVCGGSCEPAEGSRMAVEGLEEGNGGGFST